MKIQSFTPGTPEERNAIEDEHGRDIDAARVALHRELAAAQNATRNALAQLATLLGPLYDIEYVESRASESLVHHLAAARHALAAVVALNPCDEKGNLR